MGLSSSRLAASSVPSPPRTTSASARPARSRPEATRHEALARATLQGGGAPRRGRRARRARGATRRGRGWRGRPPRGRAARGCRSCSCAPPPCRERPRARPAARAVPPGTRCRKNSRLPSAPGTGDGQAPRTRVAQLLRLAGHVARAPGGAAPGPSRFRPGPPGSGPPRTGASPARPPPRRGRGPRRSAGRILRTEMNDTSITASEHGSGTTSGESERAFVRSRTTTRGSWRSLSWSCPRPDVHRVDAQRRPARAASP